MLYIVDFLRISPKTIKFQNILYRQLYIKNINNPELHTETYTTKCFTLVATLKNLQSFKFFVQIKQRCIHSNLLSYFVSSITYLLPALYLTLLTDCVDRISSLPATRPMLPTCSNRTSSTTSLTTQVTSPYSVAAKTIPSNFG